MDTINFTSELHPNFTCKICDFNCFKKGDWNRHIVTIKHCKLLNPKNITSECAIEYDCKCGKVYKHQSSLSLHKKTCSGKKVTSDDSEPSEKELIMMLLKQNSELIMKMGTNNTTNNMTNNTATNMTINNKTFNLQFFLNEECKNALNINEFVSSIKMDLEDLEKTGLLGYAEGISNIINKNLNELDQTMRPIHCSDGKREILYIKDDDKWERDSINSTKLINAVKAVDHKNYMTFREWAIQHPECQHSFTQANDTYMKLARAAEAGIDENITKVIKRVIQHVVIDKKELANQ